MLKWLRHKFNMLTKNRHLVITDFCNKHHKAHIDKGRREEMKAMCATCKHYGTSDCTGWVHGCAMSECDGREEIEVC